jgi:putative transferase (TIGR04331 family)
LPENPESLLGQYSYEVADIAIQADQLAEYFTLSDSLHRVLSNRLARAFNDLHSVQETERYWSITTGIWLRLFTELLVSRFVTLLQISQRYPELNLVSVDTKLTPRAPMNFRQHHEFLKSPAWNSVVYADIWESVKSIQPIVGQHEQHEAVLETKQ